MPAGTHVKAITGNIDLAPTIAELAKGAGVEEEEVLEALESGRAYSSLSLSSGSGGNDDGEELDPLESIGTEEHQYDVSEDRAVLAPGFRVLDERERTILTLRFGLDGGGERTLEEVAEHFGLTRERIRQIEARAMSKLRHPSIDAGARELLNG